MLPFGRFCSIGLAVSLMIFCEALLVQALNTSDSKAPKRTFSRVLKLGLITPPDGKLGFTRVAAATTMAIEQAHRDGHLVDTDVK